ncbi:MAG TPA: putative baseplate assembly protein [Caulobacteraceae bacterium]|jgi:hypothetical protein
MTQPCGCCEGVQVATPQGEANPPGLTAINYRVGDYATFYETMLARLSMLTLEITPPDGSAAQTLRPLAGLTTREPTDPAIALLDAWAVTADVLTFYQERIANEGYLPTAVERRSLVELSQLIGYRLRPGVASSVKLAFTVASGFTGVLPVGTRAQSIPGPGQSAQFFETATDLYSRDAWNTLAPRLTRQQVITPAVKDSNGIPLVSGADVIDSVYFDGGSTSLKPGDALLFVFGSVIDNTNPVQQFLRLTASVDALTNPSRTLVTLAPPTVAGLDAADQVQLEINKAEYLFPGSDLAAQAAAILAPTLANLQAAGGSTADVIALLQAPISRLALLRSVAVARGFTRVTAWLSAMITILQAPLQPVRGAGEGGVLAGGNGPLVLQPLPAALAPSALSRLGQIVDALALAPSRQPASPLRLSRSIAASFAPQSDIAPRLIAALRPAVATSLYPAWSNVATAGHRVDVYAARVKAGLFASNWPGAATILKDDSDNLTTSFADPAIATAWGTVSTNVGTLISELALDATYDQIKPGSWVAIDRPDPAGGARKTTFHLVRTLRTASVSTAQPAAGESGPSPSGFAAKVTLLDLVPNWLGELSANDYGTAIGAASVLRGTVVYAQTELLMLTEEPLDIDVSGASIELASVYDGIEAGRWVIVSGSRTDIPGVSGVTAAELAMVGGVQQGASSPDGATFPFAAPPFSDVAYTTDANAFGDRLVVGKLADPAGFPQQLAALPAPTRLDQQFAQPVQLGSGVYVNAYVPTAAEKAGDFSAFTGLVVDPTTNAPLPGGDIKSLIAAGFFAWRVSSDTLTTVINLASPLAYSYDRSTVTIYGNVIDATQGQSTGEVLGNGDATKAWLSFPLSQSPLTYASAPTPNGIASSLRVSVNELAWTELDDFAEAGPKDRAYITRENDAGQSRVTFGSGVRGQRPPTGAANIKATYRYGMGAGGNVLAGQISQLATHPLGAQGVINPMRASGGADADTLAQARSNAPLSVTALDRLVSVSDYADFSRTFAGIGKASAARISDGVLPTVHVTIAGVGDIPIDAGSGLFNNLVTALESFGDPQQALELAIQRVKVLVMAARVAIDPDRDWEDVEPALRAAVLATFAFDARELGQAAFQSEAVAALHSVPGVAWVNVTTFDNVAESVTAAQLATLAATLGLNPYVVAELAKINPKAPPGSPERITPAELVFMTPDIADTLILTQAS